MHIRAPFTEQLHIASSDILRLYDDQTAGRITLRSAISDQLCQNLDAGGPYTSSFYGDLAGFFKEQPRLALYLPFYLLKDAPEAFRNDYLNAWRSCWAYGDVRECFNLGDALEVNSYKGDVERIVKAMHLIPWLVKYGYLSDSDIESIIRLMREDKSLCWSAFDAVPVLEKERLISGDNSFKIREMMSMMPARYLAPRSILETVMREHWRAGRTENRHIGKDFKLGRVDGKFLENLVQASIPEPGDDEIILVGGALLKGYGRHNSDLDIYHYDLESRQISGLEVMALNPANIVHLIMNCAWVGKTECVTRIAQAEAASFFKGVEGAVRASCEGRLENDMLQFGLMHKGFPSAHPDDCSARTRKYDSIDGGSAFYDDRYRTIATKLFVKYVFLP